MGEITVTTSDKIVVLCHTTSLNSATHTFNKCKRLFLHSLADAPKLMSKSLHSQKWRHSQYRNCALRNLLDWPIRRITL